MSDRKKAAILLSGGVDSAVAALLMEKRGFNVEGFCMTTDYFFSNVKNRAKKIADHLGIKLTCFDVSKEFKKRVIDYFENEYKNLRTPNPCVMCNKWIKFGILFDAVRNLGFDTIVTGHYIIKKQETRNKKQINSKFQISNSKGGELQVMGYELQDFYKLQVSKDKKKDQSYFLYNLMQEHLKYLEFPLGDLTKNEVWEIARENNFPIKEGESQDICFLQGDHNQYLEKYLKLKKGPIIDKTGKILGEHYGLPLYTIGQRRYIKIGGTGPYYVLRRDIKSNTLFVTDRFDDEDLYADEFEVENFNHITHNIEHITTLIKSIKVKIRYLHPAVNVESVEKVDDKKYKIKLKEKQRAITPGQSAVFYGDDGKLLGGGIISS